MHDKIIGVDCGCTKMLMTAEVNGSFIDKVVPTGMQVTPTYLKAEIQKFISELPFEPAGIGMGVVGLVEGNTLKVSDLQNLGGMKTTDIQIGTAPVFFINDVKAAMVCEAEHYDENCTFALIMAGSGFAISVRAQGVDVLGRHGWAGELGSDPYPINGHIETLDAISGGNGILTKAGCDIDTFLKAIDNNEPFALDIIEQAGMYLGLALSNVIHLINPEYLVIGGSCIKYKGYLDNAIHTAKEYSLPALFDCCTITTPNDLKRIVALGAKRFAKLSMK